MSSRAFFQRPAVLLALGLGAIGLVVSLVGRLASGPAAEPKRVALSTQAGTEDCPAFSPDGRRLAYSARDVGAQEVFHIFVRTLPSGAPQQLTRAETGDTGPVWSPDGTSLAFLRIADGHAECLAMPAAGGAERKIAEFEVEDEGGTRPPPSLAWTHDGKSLVAVEAKRGQPASLVLIPLAGGPLRRLTDPPAKTPGDSGPALSPDGRSLAFVRAANEEGGDLYVCNLSGGNLRRLTFDTRQIRGIAWTPDGNELIYAANRAHGWRLWRLPAYGGSPREVLWAGNDASAPAIALRGKRMAFTQTPTLAAIWRAELGGTDRASTAVPMIRSTGRESRATWSPDGKKIADVSSQSGTDEIWIGDPTGVNRYQLTDLKASHLGRPRWSPDGRTILFMARLDRGPEIYTVPADRETGPTHLRLPAGSQGPSWSHDGKSIYFEAEGVVWKAAADGSNPRQITQGHGGAGEPEESADGKYVYYRLHRSIYRVPANGGKEEEAIVPEHDLWWSTIQPTAKGVYFLEFNRRAHAQVVMFHDFRTLKSTEVFQLKDADISPDTTYSVSPDGRYILYPKVDRSATSLVLVEDFR